MKEFSEAAAQMEEEAQTARLESNPGEYTIKLSKPFVWEGETYEILNFDFDSLKLSDSISAEEELRRRNIINLLPETTPEYLTILAAKACTYRNEKGMRTVSAKTIENMPIRDGRAITTRCRRFLMSAG